VCILEHSLRKSSPIIRSDKHGYLTHMSRLNEIGRVHVSIGKEKTHPECYFEIKK
jgi:hypothetical protein